MFEAYYINHLASLWGWANCIKTIAETRKDTLLPKLVFLSIGELLSIVKPTMQLVIGVFCSLDPGHGCLVFKVEIAKRDAQILKLLYQANQGDF